MLGVQHLRGAQLRAHGGHVFVLARNKAERSHKAFGFGHLGNGALFHDDNLFKHIGRFFNDVGRDDKRAACFGVIFQKQFVKIFTGHHVQPGHRFIQNGDGRARGQRQHNGNHAQHALRKLRNALFRLQAKALHQLLRIGFVPVGVIGGRGFQIVAHFIGVFAKHHHGRKLARKADVRQGPGVLPHGLAAIGDSARIPGILRRKNAEQRGFARPVAANQPIDDAGLYLEAHIVQHLLFSIAFGDVLCA